MISQNPWSPTAPGLSRFATSSSVPWVSRWRPSSIWMRTRIWSSGIGLLARSRSGKGPGLSGEIPWTEVMAATERHIRRRKDADEARAAAAPPAATPAVPGAVIEFANVSKRYPSGDIGLDGVSFAIMPGEFVFLVGASGSGKSTTMRLLIKETEPTGGTLRVAGRDLTGIP